MAHPHGGRGTPETDRRSKILMRNRPSDELSGLSNERPAIFLPSTTQRDARRSTGMGICMAVSHAG